MATSPRPRRAAAAAPAAVKPAVSKPAAVKPAVAEPRAGKAANAKAHPARSAAPAASSPVKRPKKSDASPAKLVRDSFTMPEADFALVASLKSRALGARRHAKKSELLRAGLQALARLEAVQLVQALDQLQPVKIGRPKKGADK